MASEKHVSQFSTFIKTNIRVDRECRTNHRSSACKTNETHLIVLLLVCMFLPWYILNLDFRALSYTEPVYAIIKIYLATEPNICVFFIRCTLFLSTPQLDNRQLRCWNITFYSMLGWRNCIGIKLYCFQSLCDRRGSVSAIFIAFYLILGVKWVLNTGLVIAFIIWLQ